MTADPATDSSAFLHSDPVSAWLLNDARGADDSRGVITGLSRRLLATGFPLYRLFLSIGTLHPQVATIGYQWRRGDSVASETPREHGIDRQDVYLRSPIKLIHDGSPEVRRRISDSPSPQEFPILDDLVAEGVTDYLLLPLHFSRQRINAISVATDRSGGFSNDHLQRFRNLTLLLAAVLEVKETERISSTLLTTYLGHDAGRRVLGGLIRRGDGITLTAALWYCDLRNFTATTEMLPRDEIIALLNDYFGCMVGSVHHHGGQVLKFIGDAMLAIFPIVDDLDRDRACMAALSAAEDALADLDLLNARRHADGKAILEADIALHTGAVMYGNIGAPDRLDFTVIGTAVNLVTRLERMCTELNQPLLASARFASPCGSQMVSVGQHRLRGFSQPQEIFALPPRVARQRIVEQIAS